MGRGRGRGRGRGGVWEKHWQPIRTGGEDLAELVDVPAAVVLDETGKVGPGGIGADQRDVEYVRGLQLPRVPRQHAALRACVPGNPVTADE